MNENSSEGSTGSSSVTDVIAEAFLFVAMIYSSSTFTLSLLIITEVLSKGQEGVSEAASSKNCVCGQHYMALEGHRRFALNGCGYL
jgi:hypothetical protein